MKKRLILSAAVLAMTSLSATGAEAGKAKAKDIVAPLAVTESAAVNVEELSTLWVDGRRQEITGLDQIKEGEKLIRSGQKDERKASEKLAKAVTISDEQQAAYVRLVAGFGGAATPAAVETEIKALKKAADDWKDAYERVEKAEAKLNAAKLAIANGESAARTGAELVAAGQEKMRRAEMESRPVDAVLENSQTRQITDASVEFSEFN